MQPEARQHPESLLQPPDQVLHTEDLPYRREVHPAIHRLTQEAAAAQAARAGAPSAASRPQEVHRHTTGVHQAAITEVHRILQRQGRQAIAAAVAADTAEAAREVAEATVEVAQAVAEDRPAEEEDKKTIKTDIS